MPTPLRITSTDNPRVKAALRLRESRDRRESGLLIAEGFREVERALLAGLRLVEWYACTELLNMEIAALRRRLPWNKSADDAMGYDVSVSVLKKLAYRDDPEGLLAVFEQPRWTLEGLPDDRDALLLIGVGIEKPGNLGAMARTAAAAGAAALVSTDGPIDPFNPNAIRASTGAVFSLPIVRATTDQLLAFLAGRSIRLYAAMLLDGARPHTRADFTGKCAIAIGAEDEGLPQVWEDRAVKTGGGAVTIPMRTDRVDSLNASVAAGILLFAAAGQRGPAPG
jgi:TrmH family RNA methyltransferase